MIRPPLISSDMAGIFNTVKNSAKQLGTGLVVGVTSRVFDMAGYTGGMILKWIAAGGAFAMGIWQPQFADAALRTASHFLATAIDSPAPKVAGAGPIENIASNIRRTLRMGPGSELKKVVYRMAARAGPTVMEDIKETFIPPTIRRMEDSSVSGVWLRTPTEHPLG